MSLSIQLEVRKIFLVRTGDHLLIIMMEYVLKYIPFSCQWSERFLSLSL